MKLLLYEYSENPFEVTCDQESHGGGWTVVMRRNDGSQDFFLEWKNYKDGFGQLDNEFFMGMDKLHAMTASEPQELLVLLEDYKDDNRYQLYDNFKIGPESNNYTLESLGSSNGDAGDSLIYHLGMQFSTKDRKNDIDPTTHCAELFTGAWWYRACHKSEEQRRQADILESLDKKFEFLLGNSYPANCAESSKHNLLIRVPAYSAYPFEVTCDQESHGGGWTVFLRRNDGSQEFFLEWKDYKEGFGLLENEFFMGLDKLHAMTASEPQELLVLLEDYGGIQAYALYDNFRVGPECNNYTLESVGSFSGDAGDSLTTHEGMQFSTKDRDNDVWDGNCALKYTGAWWYRDCHWSAEQERQAAILEGLDQNLKAFVTNEYPANCAESSNSSNPLIRVPGYSAYPFEVTCDQESHGGGWTVILRRSDGSQDFFLEWKDYKKGFGRLDNEFFIGLDKMHALTAEKPQELLVLLEDFNGNQAYVLYDNFSVGPESNNYTLESVGSFSGDAGDSLTYHLNSQFSTKDRDNGITKGGCAKYAKGAWWYYNCHNR
ncbi:hypothetical protein M5D96_003788 [Drosophila gunungcola]|uniref:Fibrinogen C-terminal domain-containing protein n=1 Tax=Drosophila gunungcola TaxID=103775 RepID=A0A9P9YSR8_9MUSC|nr:hypothetical protein M5D96_003788 [Drosophila gunungcola]